MLTDALTSSSNPALTSLVANTASYSDVIDLSTVRDLGPSDVPVSVLFTALPTSGTGGATLNVAIQTSPDNATWTTIEETAAQPLSGYTSTNVFAFRGTLPATVSRYIRAAYTASATLTAGAAQFQVGANWPRSKPYPRNYVS